MPCCHLSSTRPPPPPTPLKQLLPTLNTHLQNSIALASPHTHHVWLPASRPADHSPWAHPDKPVVLFAFGTSAGFGLTRNCFSTPAPFPSSPHPPCPTPLPRAAPPPAKEKNTNLKRVVASPPRLAQLAALAGVAGAQVALVSRLLHAAEGLVVCALCRHVAVSSSELLVLHAHLVLGEVRPEVGGEGGRGDRVQRVRGQMFFSSRCQRHQHTCHVCHIDTSCWFPGMAQADSRA